MICVLYFIEIIVIGSSSSASASNRAILLVFHGLLEGRVSGAATASLLQALFFKGSRLLLKLFFQSLNDLFPIIVEVSKVHHRGQQDAGADDVGNEAALQALVEVEADKPN